MAIAFPPRLSLAQRPTPLQLLPRLSAQIGGPRLWVKRDDMTGSAVSGNKIRKLEFALAAAQAEGCDTVITVGGAQSNHCRTTALLCAQLGLHCHLILRGAAASFQGEPDGNLMLDLLAGATVSCYPNSVYKAREPEILAHWQAHYRAQGRRPYAVPVGASNGVGIWGYIACAEELQNDFRAAGIAPRHIVCATGSGGTQAGLTVGNALFGLGCEVLGVAVCDNAQYFIDKVAEDIADWRARYPQAAALQVEPPVRVTDDYIGPGYGVAGPEVFDTIAELARLEGLVLDPVYTGKAFHALLQEIRKGRFAGAEDLVFVHTGGIFGLFPQRDQLRLASPQLITS